MNSVGIAPIRRVWNALSDLKAEGKNPTRRDIGERTGLNFQTVQYHLEELRAAGYVDWNDGLSSALTILVPLFTMTPQQKGIVQGWETRREQKAYIAALEAKMRANGVPYTTCLRKGR